MRTRSYFFLALATVVMVLAAGPLPAQKPPDPEVGYVFPPGAQRGQTVTVQLAGFDWTPDLEFFTLDPRVKLTVEGLLTRHLMPGPPFPIGMKAYRPPALPREITARIEIPADLPPGPVRWQVANANGVSNTGVFMVGDGPEVIENRDRENLQRLEQIPVTVSGRLSRYEEVDAYIIEPLHDGLITADLAARRLGANFNGVLEVKDERNRMIADASDSAGLDPRVTWLAQAGQRYRVLVHDLSFRGNRAYVYRLSLTTGPQVLAAIPAVGQRGTTSQIELVGYGLSTGQPEIERITHTVSFPAESEQLTLLWRGETEAGQPIAFSFPLSDVPELVSPIAPTESAAEITPPAAITGRLDRQHSSDRYNLAGKQGELWNIAVQARRFGSPLDVTLSIHDSSGKQLVASDDLPGTTDAGLEFSVPADGLYQLAVSDVSGAQPSPLNLYRLEVKRSVPDFTLQVPQHLNVPIGEKTELLVKAVRTGGCQMPISLTIAGLPTGISLPEDVIIPGDQTELKLSLQSAADAPSGASLVTITGTAQIGEQKLTHAAQAQAGGNLAPRSPDELHVGSIVIASTMKPVTKIRPIETDERTVHRGTIHLAELAIERTAGFDGEVWVQMDSRQPAKFRQGVIGPDVVVPPRVDRVFYPCLVPEIAETVDAYRILLVALAKVPDARGRVRYLLSKMQADDASVAITVEGALLKISAAAGRVSPQPGGDLQIPVKVARSAKLPFAVRLELHAPRGMEDAIQAAPVSVPPGQTEAMLSIRMTGRRDSGKKIPLTIRALAIQPGTPPILSDAASATPMDPELLDMLKAGLLPVIAETTVLVDVNAIPATAN